MMMGLGSGALVTFAAILLAQGALTNVVKNSVDGQDIAKCLLGEDANGIMTCATKRALSVIDAASQKSQVELFPGVSLISENPASARSAKSLDAEEDLPVATEQRADKLFDILLESASSFISGRTLQVKMPKNLPEVAMRAFEEGRGKMKKMMGPMMLIVLAKLLLMKLAVGGLALMATKALIIAKLAFLIAAIVGLPSLFAGSGGLLKGGLASGGWGGNGYSYGSGYAPASSGGWSTGNSGGWTNGNQAYPYARSYEDGQEAAYAAQKP